MDLIVRPFKTIIGSDFHPSAFHVTGQILENTFRFSIGSASFDIPALKTGADQFGEFAVLEEAVRVLRDGFRLSVQLDPPSSSDEEPGCTIAFYKPNIEQARLQREYPEAIVLLPVASSISIDFGSLGHLAGNGMIVRSSDVSEHSPPKTKH